jgi:hypothetical protein
MNNPLEKLRDIGIGLLIVLVFAAAFGIQTIQFGSTPDDGAGQAAPNTHQSASPVAWQPLDDQYGTSVPVLTEEDWGAP